MKDLPPRLYKYFRFSEYSIGNLEHHTIWFSKVCHFNDPFDCHFDYRLHVADDDEWEELLRVFASRGGGDPDDFVEHYMKPENRVALILAAGSRMRAIAANAKNTQGVCCFSETIDNLLMWAYYADGHRGFCVEYDTSFSPFEMARDVNYSDDLPVADPVSMLANRQSEILIQAMCQKSCEWAHEGEWRLFCSEGDKSESLDPNAFLGVYFGCAMPESQQERIMARIEQQGGATKCYKMRQSESEFKVLSDEL